MTTRRALLSRFTVTARDDAGVAMITAIIAIVLTAMLSILMLGILVSQKLPTIHLQASSKTIFAAEAGMNAVVGQIRNAELIDGAGNTWGDRTLLPCTAQGSVEANPGQVRYDVTVDYFLVDPRGRDEAWVASNRLPCSGSGTTIDPSYALITSTGVGPGAGLGEDAGNRTVQVVYEFQITNTNIPGGLIYSFDEIPEDSGLFCLQADAQAVGAHVRYVPQAICGTDNIHQLWLYDRDYKLKLASTTIGGLVDEHGDTIEPLCITGPVGTTSPQAVTLQVCRADTDPERWNQLWSWQGGSKWQGQRNPVSAGYSAWWLFSGANSGSPSGRLLSVGNGSYSSDKQWISFNPDPRVGAGAAGRSTQQIVNYLEFGRCLDVTNANTGFTGAYLIAYPCKQDPTGGTLMLWNHKWTWDEPPGEVGSITTQIRIQASNGAWWCVFSRGDDNSDPWITSACNASAANQRWTRYADTGNYGTSYTFVDYQGRCLSLGGPKHNGDWARIKTHECNQSLMQKWNAPPRLMTATLDAYRELPGAPAP